MAAGVFLGSEDIRGNCPWKAPRELGPGSEEGVSPLRWERGLGRGSAPSPEIFFVILHLKWCIFMQFGVGIFTLKGV